MGWVSESLAMRKSDLTEVGSLPSEINCVQEQFCGWKMWQILSGQGTGSAILHFLQKNFFPKVSKTVIELCWYTQDGWMVRWKKT